MLRNYLTAALRNLVRNRLHAFLNLLGLSLGLAAALLALLYVRHELSYDRFIPGNARVYVMVSKAINMGADKTPAYFATWMKTDFPDVKVARLMPTELSVRKGDQESIEQIGWGDPNLFSLLPLPVVAGELATALKRPDSVVLTRRMARKYFGRDNPIGETLEINRTVPLQVVAVIEDLPTTTHLAPEIYGSARNPAFGLVQIDEKPYDDSFNSQVMTYVALPPATASIAGLQRAMPNFVERHLHKLLALTGISIQVAFVPLVDLHLYPNVVGVMKPHGNPAAVAAVGGAGILTVLLAVINFVNLMTARSARRAVEVGVRKVSGAAALHLITQLIGEALLYAMLAATIAVVLVHLSLPAIDSRVAPGLAEQWLTAPVTVSAVGLALAIGFLGGIYPAFVLAAFRPADVLKGRIQAPDSGLLRQILVVLQFGGLIALMLATLVIYRQTIFSLRDGLRVAHDQVLLVYAPCHGAFLDEVRALPGVTALACSNRDPLNAYGFTEATRNDGTPLSIGISGVGFGYFDLYGIGPLAGRLFDQRRDAGRADDTHVPLAIINETAVHSLGFASPEAAIGQTFKTVQNQGGPPTQIIGVVPDFTFDLMTTRIPPIMYVGTVIDSTVLNVKLSGNALPETLGAIDALWKRDGEPRPIRRLFVDQHLQSNYVEVIRQGSLIGGLSATAIVIAFLGLFGLSSFTAERRTKEIGIRKAMGASRADVLRLLLWQFTKPVLWANVIAWPAAYLIMRHWLEGFAYHIDLEPWMFLAVSALAIVIALATVIGHALLVARAKPVAALRYE